MVAPLLEVLLLRVLSRRSSSTPAVPPTRLVSRTRRVDSLGHVLGSTTVLLARPGAPVEVLPPGSLVWPPFLTRGRTTYAVLTHTAVDVRLRIGPFDSHEGRTITQVELRLRLTLSDSPAVLGELLEGDALARGASGPDDPLDGFGERLLERLARAVSSRTAEAVHRRTIDELADLSLQLVLDEALPTTFLGDAVTRTGLEVLDVDWPTEGRGWSHAAAALGRPGAGP